jgi:hypothetical protein
MTVPLKAQGAAASETAMSADVLVQRGKQLRAEIDAEYHRLKKSQKLDRGTDVTSIVTKYIPINGSLGDAKRILQAARCKERGGQTPDGHLFFRIKIGGEFVSSTLFTVELVPQTPGDFTIVQAVSGTILVVDI